LALPPEASWAREKIAEASTAILDGDWATSAAKLDVARLHLERAALRAGQSLTPRTSAAQALELKHGKLRGVMT
jgi:hypothetical protein